MAVKKDISAIKRLLKNKVNNNFSIYSKIYAFTTENIAAYYANIDFCDKKILTICSSGDHILNACLLGCRKIDCFDINIFTKYYMFLKLSAVKILSYQEFNEFFIGPSRFCVDLYSKVSHLLEDDIKLFWDSIYENYNVKDVIDKLFMKTDYVKTSGIYNLYLKEENYNLLKSILLTENIEISFIQSDVLDLYNKISGNYDYIFLSNIVDYLSNYYNNESKKNYINYINNFLIKNINVNKIYFCYIYNYNLKSNLFSFNGINYMTFSNGVNVGQIDSVGMIDIKNFE